MQTTIKVQADERKAASVDVIVGDGHVVAGMGEIAASQRALEKMLQEPHSRRYVTPAALAHAQYALRAYAAAMHAVNRSPPLARE